MRLIPAGTIYKVPGLADHPEMPVEAVRIEAEYYFITGARFKTAP